MKKLFLLIFGILGHANYSMADTASCVREAWAPGVYKFAVYLKSTDGSSARLFPTLGHNDSDRSSGCTFYADSITKALSSITSANGDIVSCVREEFAPGKFKFALYFKGADGSSARLFPTLGNSDKSRSSSCTFYADSITKALNP